jgi:hypothetical protein
VTPFEITKGESVELSWAVADASFVSIAPGTGGTLPPSGSTIAWPQEDTTYVLYAENDVGEAVSVLISVKVLPAPRWWPAPTLLEPGDGANFGGWNDQVTLRWRSVGALARDEYYVVRIPYDDLGGVDEFWRKETFLEVPQNYSLRTAGFDDRHYDWSVQVMRCTDNCDLAGADDVKKQGVAAGEESRTRTFYWHPDAGGGTQPINTPPS